MPLSESAPGSSESSALGKSYRHANQIMIKASDQNTLWVTYNKAQKRLRWNSEGPSTGVS